MLSGALFLALLVTPASASAEVVLPFCATYIGSDGSSSTHRGIDVAMPGDAEVFTPISGTVKFVGRVPRAGGGTITAITIDSAMGAVTLLPFGETRVEVGQSLSAGDAVGVLAEAGDPSVEQSHLHVGLKRSGVYVDPEPLFTAPPTLASSSRPSPVPAEAPKTAAAPTSQAQVKSSAPAVVIGASSGAYQAAGAGASAPARQPLASSAAAAAPKTAGAQTSEPAVVIQGGESAASQVKPAPQQAFPPGATALFRAIALPVLALALAAVAFAAVYLGTQKAFLIRVSNLPVSDRLGTLLQHLKAGDTLRGLTSCSGPLPSQSRGHLAQRR